MHIFRNVLSLGLLSCAFSAVAYAETYRVVVPKPGFKYRNDLGQQLTQTEVREQLPDGSWNIHSTISIYDGDEKIAEYTSPNMTIDSPEGFSDTGVVGTRYFYRLNGNTWEYNTIRGFLYANGVFQEDIYRVNGQSGTSQAHAVNNRNQAVGIYSNWSVHYDNGATTSIGFLMPGLSNAFGINNHGEVTGWLIEEGLWSAFHYTPASSSSPAKAVKLGYLDPTHPYT